MKYLFFLICISGFFSGSATTPEDDILAILNQLFDGMKAGDSTMVRNTFTENARLMTVFEKEGEPILRVGNLDGFVKAVGAPHDEVWNEFIWDTKIDIDGNLAQVWTRYAFYRDDQFSHCGVDAFQLFKGENGWKIFQLADTRQFENCPLPPEK